MNKLKEVIELSISNQEKLLVWVAIPTGILHGQIKLDQELTDDGFSLIDAKFLYFKNDIDDNHYSVDKAQVSYSHVAAWGYDKDLQNIV